MIIPTIGRVVWYHAYPKIERQPYPAFICYVHSNRLINIAGFEANGLPFSATSVLLRQEGEDKPEFAYAEWMPYQQMKAKEENK